MVIRSPSTRSGERAPSPDRASPHPREGSMSDADSARRAWRIVLAATVFNLPIGSLYAFSVLLRPLEVLLGVGRADLALVFALAAAGFGVGTNLAPAAYRLATATGLGQLVLGYGLLFGAGGGAGYLVTQQAVNLTVTRHRGLVNGYLVSLYPLGAMIAAPILGWSARDFGVRAALGGLAAVLALTGAASAWLIVRSRATLVVSQASAAPGAHERRRDVFCRLWFVFFLAASAGLMVLSQAAAIISAYGGAAPLAIFGTTFVTGCIAAARVGGGWMADWLAIPVVAAGAHAVALMGNVALTIWPGPAVSVFALTLVGLGYGVISGVIAASVAVYWRRALYGRVASRLYVEWCAAAIVLPIAAGRLFDLTQGYRAAVMIAAGGNALGLLVALGLPRPSEAEDSESSPR